MALAGPYALWTAPASGYVRVGTIAGTLSADRTAGRAQPPLLRSALPRPVILRRFFSAIARQRVRNSPNHRADVPPA